MNEKRLGMEKFSNNRKKGNKKRAVQEPLKLRRKFHLTDSYEICELILFSRRKTQVIIGF